MLEVKEVTKSFGTGNRTVTAVNNVTMAVPDGEFAAIVGRSGSGKSTLMNLLGALERPTSGMIFVDGQDITRLGQGELVQYRQRSIGFVFQSYNLIPNLSSAENVMLPMEFTGVGKDERRQRARSLLDQVELTGDKQHRRPGKLSGDEQQRVAIARALANSPKLILADEPVGNLDTQTSATVIELLRSLAHARGTTVIAVTHDLSLADRADRVFRLQDGRLQAADGSGPGTVHRRCGRQGERPVSVLSRGVRNAFRSPVRAIAIVVILGLTIGLSFVMLIGHQSVENKVGTTLASIGTTVNITPVGYGTGSTANAHLTTAELSQVAQLPDVVGLDEALPGSLPSGGTAGTGRTLAPGSPGAPLSIVGTNDPATPSNIGASTLAIVAGHMIDGTGDADDAMVSTTVAERNHLKWARRSARTERRSPWKRSLTATPTTATTRSSCRWPPSSASATGMAR